MASIVDVDGVSRANAYLIPPEQLEQGDNSRRWPDQDVVELALDIVDRGQLVPVLVAWDKGEDKRDRLVVVDGNRRVAAINYINSMGLVEGGPVKVLCQQYKGTGEEKFAASVATNLKRKGLTPIDLAHSIATLEKGGKSRKEIAKLLEVSESLITQTLKLLTLSASLQKDIHAGRLAASVGYELASMAPEDRNEAVKVATTAPAAAASTATGKGAKSSGGQGQDTSDAAAPAARVTRESVRKVKRDKAERGEETTGPKARSRKVVHNLFTDWAGCEDGTIEDPIRKLCAAIVKWMDGETGDRAVLNRMREMLEGE